MKRHRRKFFITGAIIGGFAIVARIADRRFREWQQKEAEALMETARREQHFTSTIKTCDSTINGLATALNDTIFKLLDCDELTERLKGKPDDRYSLFEQLKVIAFARVVASIYASTAMVTMVRIQLSVLGGCMYADTVADSGQDQVSMDSQHSYLALVQHLLCSGCEVIAEVARRSVDSVMAGVSLKEPIKLCEIQEKLTSIRKVFDDVCLQQPGGLMFFAMPSGDSADGVGIGEHRYMQLVRDTKDLFESEDCQNVIVASLDVGFSMLVDLLTTSFTTPVNGSLNVESFRNPNDVAVPLAKLLAPMNNGASCMFARKPDHFVSRLLVLPAQQMMAANIYEAFINSQENK